MSTRKILALIATAVALFGLWWFFKSLGPSGPLIVIRPGPAWYIGCPNPKNPNGLPDPAANIGSETQPGVAHQLFGWTKVSGIAVKLRSQHPPIASKRIGGVALDIDGMWLEITIAHPGAPPNWKYGGSNPRAIPSRPVGQLPAEFLGAIRSIKVLDWNGVEIGPPVGLQDLEEIRISYERDETYQNCR